MRGDGPRIATVLPVLNEATHLQACLESLLHQTIDPSSHIIMVFDGGSNDGTQGIVEACMAQQNEVDAPQLVLHSNPQRTVAHARNLALKMLPESVELVVEMIGHATVEKDHLQQRLDAWDACEQRSEKPLGAVGVRVESMDEHPGAVSRWIDAALHSPLGQSGGQFSRFSKIGTTDVPAFATHSRHALESVGGWDEAFITSQDSDLSMRMKKAGFALYRSPNATVKMHKRARLQNWWKMGHRYGFWRTKVLRKHPSRAKWQEFLPWLGALVTVALALSQPAWAWLLPGLYVAVLLLSGTVYGMQNRDLGGVVGVPLCLLILHASFSIGLLDGLIRKGRPPSDRG